MTLHFLSSSLSALTVIGIPYEIYYFGTHYVTSSLGVIMGMFLLWYTVLPVFCGNLNIKTPYEVTHIVLYAETLVNSMYFSTLNEGLTTKLDYFLLVFIFSIH